MTIPQTIFTNTIPSSQKKDTIKDTKINDILIRYTQERLGVQGGVAGR